MMVIQTMQCHTCGAPLNMGKLDLNHIVKCDYCGMRYLVTDKGIEEARNLTAAVTPYERQTPISSGGPTDAVNAVVATIVAIIGLTVAAEAVASILPGALQQIANHAPPALAQGIMFVVIALVIIVLFFRLIPTEDEGSTEENPT